MATVKPIASTAGSRPGRRRGRTLALALAVLAIGLLAWFWRPLNAYAMTGASVGARLGCSCRYVEGRPLRDCRDDFERGMGMVRLSEDEQARSVTASFPLLARQTATFRAGQGCVLEKWPG